MRRPSEQSDHFESAGMKYINRFAIEEDDQFEINGIYHEAPMTPQIPMYQKKPYYPHITVAIREAFEELAERQIQGLDKYFYKTITLHCILVAVIAFL